MCNPLGEHPTRRPTDGNQDSHQRQSPMQCSSIPFLASECMYAVGQGAIAVECREDDFETLSFLSILHHESTVYRVVAERALLKVLEGGCSAPVAVSTGKREYYYILRK